MYAIEDDREVQFETRGLDLAATGLEGVADVSITLVQLSFGAVTLGAVMAVVVIWLIGRVQSDDVVEIALVCVPPSALCVAILFVSSFWQHIVNMCYICSFLCHHFLSRYSVSILCQCVFCRQCSRSVLCVRKFCVRFPPPTTLREHETFSVSTFLWYTQHGGVLCNAVNTVRCMPITARLSPLSSIRILCRTMCHGSHQVPFATSGCPTYGYIPHGTRAFFTYFRVLYIRVLNTWCTNLFHTQVRPGLCAVFCGAVFARHVGGACSGDVWVIFPLVGQHPHFARSGGQGGFVPALDVTHM